MNPELNKSRDGDTHPESLGVPPLSLPRTVGDYELIEEAARGGMGVVYRARQISLDRQVAVKVVLEGSFASEEQFKRFRLEAEQASKIHHPAVVSIHHVGEVEGRPFFSMDWIDGKRLDHYLESKPLDPSRALLFAIEIADALNAIHAEGVIHRDLKPGNIVIDRNGRVVIVDFGLAKSEDQALDFTTMGDVLGTPAYMSPEQAAGHSSTASFSSDIYSVGAVLYFLLSGRPPFVGATAPIVLRQVEEREPLALRTLVPEVPKDLATIVHQCLQKQPERRYASARLLKEDLERAERGEAILARSPGVSERLFRWCKRRPAVAGLALALSAVLAFTIIWGGYQLGATKRALGAAETARTGALRARVETLQSATPAAAESQLSSFAPEDLAAIEPELDALLASSSLTPHQRQRLSLLQMSIKPAAAFPQIEAATSSIEDPAEILLTRKVLKRFWSSVDTTQRNQLLQRLENEVQEGRAGAKRLQAASWLAALKPESSAWTGIETFLVNTLVSEPPLRFPVWLECLEPASLHLLPTTLARLRDESLTDVRREGEIIALWSKDRPKVLIEALCSAPSEALPPLVAALAPHLSRDPSVRKALEQASQTQPFSLRAPPKNEWPGPTAETTTVMQEALGEIHDLCAWALKVEPAQLNALASKLGESGYRPVQAHSWRDQDDKVFLAVTWLRDGVPFHVNANCSATEAQATHRKLSKQGFVASHVNSWTESGESRHTLLWTQGETETRIVLDQSLAELGKTVHMGNRSGEEPTSMNYRVGREDGEFSISMILGRYWRDPNLFFSAARPYAGIAAGVHPGRQLSDLEYIYGDTARRERYGVLEGDIFKKRLSYARRLGLEPRSRTELNAVLEQVRDQIEEEDILLGWCLDFRKLRRPQAQFDMLEEMSASDIKALRDWAMLVHPLLAARLGEPYPQPIETLIQEGGQSPLLNGLLRVAQSEDPAPSLSMPKGAVSAIGLWEHAQVWAARAYVEEKKNPELSRQATLNAIAALKESLSQQGWTLKQQKHIERNPWWSTVRGCSEWDELAPRYGVDLWCGLIWRSVDNEESQFVALQTPNGLAAGAPDHLEAGWCPRSINVLPDGPNLRASVVWVRPRITAAMRRDAHQRRANAMLALAGSSLVDAFEVPDASSPLLLQVSMRARRLGLGPQALLKVIQREDPRPPIQLWALLCTLAESSFEELSPEEARALAARLTELVAIPESAGDADGHWGGVKAAARLSLQRLQQSSIWPNEAEGEPSDLAPAFVTVDMRAPFLEGSLPGEPGRSYYEERRLRSIGRVVRVAVSETTVGQFGEFIRAHPGEQEGHKDRGVGDPSLPVIGVSVADAMKFCRWLSEKEGIPESEMCYAPVDEITMPIQLSEDLLSRRGYRLMTEAEHEFLSKQGGNDEIWFGSDQGAVDLCAWSLLNSGQSRKAVMTRLPSPWGVSDLFGNALEYCDGDWFPGLDDSAPPLSRDRRKRIPLTRDTPVPLRGSSFNSLSLGFRAAKRFKIPIKNPIRAAGFRIVQTVSTKP